MPGHAKGVFIDFVGTMVSFKPDPDGAMAEMHAELVRNGTSIDLAGFRDAYEAAHLKYRKMRYEQLVEVSNEVWIRDALDALHVDGSGGGLSRILAEAYFRSFVNGVSILPGVEETLGYLRSRGYKLAVVSNFSYAPVPERLLRQFGLDGYFDAVVISGNIGYRKPHRAIFERAAAELRIRTDEAVMVGDTQTEDVYGAKRLGMKAYQMRDAVLAYYTPYGVSSPEEQRFLRPDAVIASFSGLRDLL